LKSQFDFRYLEETREAQITRDLFIHHFHKKWRKYAMVYEALETRYLFTKEILAKLVRQENHGSPYVNIGRVSRCLNVLANLGLVDASFVPTNRKSVVNRIYRRKLQ